MEVFGLWILINSDLRGVSRSEPKATPPSLSTLNLIGHCWSKPGSKHLDDQLPLASQKKLRAVLTHPLPDPIASERRSPRCALRQTGRGQTRIQISNAKSAELYIEGTRARIAISPRITAVPFQIVITSGGKGLAVSRIASLRRGLCRNCDKSCFLLRHACRICAGSVVSKSFGDYRAALCRLLESARQRSQP